MGTYINGKYEVGYYVKGKVIVITGASSGFGAATARKAAALGAKVVLAARREDRLKAIVEEIRAQGGDAHYIRTDIRDRKQAEAMVQFAIDTYGRVDVLVNDAGTMPQAAYADHEWAMEAWEACLDTALKGTLYCTCAVYDHMIAQGQGHVINVSSILGNFPVAGSAVYCTSKVGVRFMAESLRTEARGKIKTTTVRPTSVSTTELGQTVVDATSAMAGMYGKLFDVFAKNPQTCPGMKDRDSVQLVEPTADDLADNIIYVIDQPWGVDISDITVRATGEYMFV